YEPGRGSAEESGPVHRVFADARIPVLSGSGPAAAESHLCRHPELPWRVPDYITAERRTQPRAALR
ncbi:hypothetical protein M9458_038862, partial [Cirrhinus mrigala]